MATNPNAKREGVDDSDHDVNPDPGTVTPTSNELSSGIAGVTGGISGAAAGGVAGAALGSVVPIVGTVIGGAVGAIVGAVGGSVAGKAVGDMVDPADPKSATASRDLGGEKSAGKPADARMNDRV